MSSFSIFSSFSFSLNSSSLLDLISSGCKKNKDEKLSSYSILTIGFFQVLRFNEFLREVAIRNLLTTKPFFTYVEQLLWNFKLMNLISYDGNTVWKNENFTITRKIFRENNLQYNTTSISRNFCNKLHESSCMIC